MTHVLPRLDGSMRALFWEVLRERDYFTQQQITEGLLPRLYPRVEELPTPPPLGATAPHFAVVDVEGHPNLAYWDFLGSGGWILTEAPWNTPVLFPEYLVSQDDGLGSGQSSWRYAMGPEFHVTRACQIEALGFKFGQGNRDHAWAIRRSTQVGTSAPPLPSYTEVLDSGVVTVASANQWTELTLGTSVELEVDQWVVVQTFPGNGSGQRFQIADARAAGQVNEAFAQLTAGTYVYRGGNNPGSTAPPTARIASTCYGLVSPKFGAR